MSDRCSVPARAERVLDTLSECYVEADPSECRERVECEIE